MLELGHAQVGDGDEVGCGSVAACSSFRLLQQSVHGLDEGVGSVVNHAAHHRIDVLDDRLGQLLKRLKSAASGPACPSAQADPRKLHVVARRSLRIDLAQRHLQSPRPRTLEARMLQPVHRIRLLDRPAFRVPAHPPHQTLDGLAVCRAKGKPAGNTC